MSAPSRGLTNVQSRSHFGNDSVTRPTHRKLVLQHVKGIHKVSDNFLYCMSLLCDSRQLRLARRAFTASSPSHNSACFLDESPAELPTSTRELYNLINKVERSIGGDAGVLGMSGSVSRLDMASILAGMGVDSSSNFLDIGSGLGRPMLHALHYGAATVSGVEFDHIKHVKSQTVISRVLPITDQARTCCLHKDVMSISSLQEIHPKITHIYSFWQGITRDARAAVGKLIREALQQHRHVSSVAFVQAHQDNLDSYMESLSFPRELFLYQTYPVCMMGSAAKFKVYIFRVLEHKIPLAIETTTSDSATSIVKPPKGHRKRRNRLEMLWQDHADHLADNLGGYGRTRDSKRLQVRQMLNQEISKGEESLTREPVSAKIDSVKKQSLSVQNHVKETSTQPELKNIVSMSGNEVQLAGAISLQPWEILSGDFILQRRLTRSLRHKTGTEAKPTLETLMREGQVSGIMAGHDLSPRARNRFLTPITSNSETSAESSMSGELSDDTPLSSLASSVCDDDNQKEARR